MSALARSWSRRRLLGLGLLLAALLGGLAWLLRREPAWPVRLVVQTGGPSWDEAGRRNYLSTPEAFAPDAALLVVAEPGRLTVWDCSSGQRRAAWSMPQERTVYQAGFSLDGRTLAALSWDGKSDHLMIELLDATTGQVRHSLPAPGGGIVHGGLVFMDGGRVLRVLAFDKHDPLGVLDCEVETGQVRARRTLSRSPRQDSTHVSGDGKLLAFALPPPGKAGAVAATDVMLWDIDRDQEIDRLSGSTPVATLALSDDASTLAIGREGGAVEVWDLDRRQLRAVFHPHSASFDPRLIWLSPDGRILASIGRLAPRQLTVDYLRWRFAVFRGQAAAGPPHELVVIETTGGRPLLRTSEEGRPVFSPDGRLLATLQRDGSVSLRDLPAASVPGRGYSRSP
jgi:WD40 repeat protein